MKNSNESESSKNKFYGLKNIADWQLQNDQSVKLPELQRSFVWSPSQIETLWDSILRGFPIGSFLMTQSGDELLLMDGQQRSTSIAYGFFNPWSESQINFFDKKNQDHHHIPVIWIDLEPEAKLTNSHKFLIKITTRSHPWGYRSKNNRETLSMSDRRKAVELFRTNPTNANVIKYTDFQNRNVFPFDANLPIPLSFLLEEIFENENEDLQEKLLRKLENTNLHFIHENYLSRVKQKINSQEFSELINKLKKLKSYEIPAIITNGDVLKGTDNSEENGSSDPTLFVRLNSQGTAITGEELIYSIFKAEFPKFKQAIEEMGADFILPSKLIAIIIRKSLSDLDANNFKNSLSVNDFRKKIVDTEFKNKLIEIISEETISKYLQNTVGVLSSDNQFQLPKILIKYLINNNAEIFTLFLLSVQDRNFTTEQKLELKKSFVKACWFSLDGKAFVKQNWKEAIENENFWLSANWKKLEIEDYFISPLFDKKNLMKFVSDMISRKIDHNGWVLPDEIYPAFYSLDVLNNKKEYISRAWGRVFNTLVWNKEVLIFVQRDYFNNNFAEYNSLDVLTSTNRPWDWDHIYPASNVYNQKYVDAQIRNLYNHNYNFRALSYDVNRSESDSLYPTERFNTEELRKDFFIKDNDYEYWSKVNKRVHHAADVENLLNAFKHRLVNIYEDIYDNLS